MAISMLAMPFLGKAQFGYVGAGVGIRTTTFYKEKVFFSDKTKHTPITFEVSGMYRPLRFLGLGATISFPVHESSLYSLGNAEVSNSSYRFEGFGSYGSGTKANPEFMPKGFGYSYEQSVAVTLKARLYALPKAGFYFDLRLSFMSLTENFIIQRASSNPEILENYNHTESISILMPGIGMGIQQHISKNLYFDLSANLDFMNIQNNGFSHEVSYTGYVSDLKYVTFADQIGGKHTSFGLQFSLGYFFKYSKNLYSDL